MTGQALFHLGMPKTGTSVLQNVLHRATKDGPVDGVDYPAFGRARAIAHHALPEALRGATPAATPAGLAIDLLADLRDGPSRRVAVYSSEGFANLCGIGPAPVLADFLGAVGQGVPVQAVLTLREMTSFLESMYLQSARFGHMTAGFDAYLGARDRWWTDLLAGLALLRDRLGARFDITLAAPGFDVLADFAARLSLPQALLADIARSVPSTAKFTWKAQVALMHLPQVEAALGFRIRRLSLVKAFQTGLAFEGDLARYTLFPPGARARLAGRMAGQATAGGLVGYADLFGGTDDGDAPFAPLAPSALGPADLDRLAAVRARIEAPPER